MIPSYLDDLELPQVFAVYAVAVDCYIQQSCFNEHIVDSTEHKICGFVRESFGQSEEAAGKFFSVENPSGQPYALLQIDNGIIQSSSTKKCDCALANKTSLCLVEFKANAFSPNPVSLHQNYRKAIEQLTVTIGIFNSYFIGRGKSISSLRTVEAFICFRRGYPRSTSSQMNYKVVFASLNYGIPLFFERKKVF